MIRIYRHSFIIPRDDEPASFTVLSGIDKLLNEAMSASLRLMWTTLHVEMDSEPDTIAGGAPFIVCRASIAGLEHE